MSLASNTVRQCRKSQVVDIRSDHKYAIHVKSCAMAKAISQNFDQISLTYVRMINYFSTNIYRELRLKICEEMQQLNRSWLQNIKVNYLCTELFRHT